MLALLPCLLSACTARGSEGAGSLHQCTPPAACCSPSSCFPRQQLLLAVCMLLCNRSEQCASVKLPRTGSVLRTFRFVKHESVAGAEPARHLALAATEEGSPIWPRLAGPTPTCLTDFVCTAVIAVVILFCRVSVLHTSVCCAIATASHTFICICGLALQFETCGHLEGSNKAFSHPLVQWQQPAWTACIALA